MKKSLLLSCFISVALWTVAQCPTNLSLTSQSAVNDFPSTYPSCTQLTGYLTIQGADITDLSPLSQLTSVGGRIVVSGCSNLTTLFGLQNITTIGGRLEILSNPLLSDMNGLSGLALIGDRLVISGNAALTTLAGLSNLNTLGGRLEISNNPNLAYCSASGICDYLPNPSGTITITGNSTGCNSSTEILDICSSGGPGGPSDPCPSDANGNQFAFWQNLPSPGYGTLFTGVNCLARVGIGTDNPLWQLDVRGTTASTDFRLLRNDKDYFKSFQVGQTNFLMVKEPFTSLNFSDDDPLNQYENGVWGIEYHPGSVGEPGTGGLNFWKPWPNPHGHGNYFLFLSNTGNVGIGTNKTPYKLSVDGSVGARSVRVELDSWSDHVFDPNYKLLSLEELACFIQENNRLPNVPSESEVIENGIDVGKTNAVLLEKIEELTLYILQLQKEIDELRKIVQP